MNAGSPGPPADTPPPELPADAAAPAEPVAAGAPAPESQAPSSYFPPPSGAPPAAARRGSAGRLVGIVAVVVILIVLVVGYGAGGYLYAGGKLNSANDVYNGVVAHQNALTDTIKSLDTQFPDVSSASPASVDQARGTVGQMISNSQAAQPQIAADDASLATASASLNENTWLTALRKPDIDKAQTRITHLRNALAVAKTLTADYVQVGNFEQALLNVTTDLEDLGAKAQATDLNGADTADQKLKADVDKATSLDKAPGMPASMDQLMQDLKALANDFGTLITDAKAGDATGAQNAEKALEADAAKLQALDQTKMNSDIKAYYDPLIAQYNAEIDKANST